MKPLPSVFSAILLVSLGLSEGTNTPGLKVTNGNITEPKGAPGGSNGLCDTEVNFPDCEECCELMDSSIASLNSATDWAASTYILAAGVTDTLWQQGTPPFLLEPGNEITIIVTDTGPFAVELSQQAATEVAGCLCTDE